MPFDAPAHATIRPRIGISSCLLGEAVRFDGGHKRDRFLTETFSQFVDLVPVCPELDAGFGTPRETMRLALRCFRRCGGVETNPERAVRLAQFVSGHGDGITFR